MGLFSSSTTPESTPDLTKKSARKVCWESRDKYFACLDKHNILDPRKDPATALAKCSSEDAEFNRDCVKSWSMTQRRAAVKAAKPFSHFLTDTYNRTHNYLRISLTERCNLRCVYCMPADGVELSPAKHLLTTPEILRLAGLFVNEGVTKIRLTGGEPTLRRDLIDLMAGLHALPGLQEICITSNGLALHRKLPLMAQHGLTSLNLSLDTLVPAKFALLTRRPEQGLSAVLRALETAKGLGIPRIKLNVVVMRGVNDDEVVDFVHLARDHAIQVRFIEYMPFGGNRWQEKKMVTYAELRDTIEQSVGAPLELIPAQPGDTAKNYRLPGDTGGGSVGFITSMTDHFCGTCTRLRLTADGNIKVCLFDNAEVSLRDQLRAGATDPQLLTAIGAAVHGKREKHAGLGDLEKMENRPMVLIGG